MEIKSGKFIMVAITCVLLGSLNAMKPYRNAVIICDTDKQRQQVELYANRIGLTLKDR